MNSEGKHESRKWAQLAVNGPVRRDPTRDNHPPPKQHEHSIPSSVDLNAAIVAATSLLSRCGAAYEAASGPTRRDYNQAWFERNTLDVDEYEVVQTAADATDFI